MRLPFAVSPLACPHSTPPANNTLFPQEVHYCFFCFFDAMKKYALIGFPLSHSFSAAFFTEKFSQEQIAATYVNHEIESLTEVPQWITSEKDLCGFNITIPHKQNILSLLDSLSDEAAEIGAVNVVRIQRNSEGVLLRLEGFNTDVIGFRESLRPLLQSHQKQALVLGTGGASKAIVVGLRQLGIQATYVSRSRPSSPIHVGKKEVPLLTYDELTAEKIHEFQIIVNCSPLGTFPHVDTFPPLPYEALNEQHLLYDLVYNPAETCFLQKGKHQGATIKNGLEMLHLQALAAWNIWNEAIPSQP